MTRLQRAFAATAAAVVIGSGTWIAAQTQGPASALVGTWMLNKELSDLPPGRAEGGGDRHGPSGGGYGRGGGRGGSHGGGSFPGGFGGGHSGRDSGSPDSGLRRQEELRGILEAPQRLTIVDTGSMLIVTTGDGRTIRLSPDGTKIRDESTGVERKTAWQSGKLVSEISGNKPNMKEIYSVDTGHRELLVIVQVEGSDHEQPLRVFHRIYQPDAH